MCLSGVLFVLIICCMNPIIKDESMLSSISNISVRINPNEGSSIFNFSMIPNHFDEPSQKACQVKLDDIFPRDEQAEGSIMDRLIKKDECHNHSIIPFLPQPIVPHFVNNSFNSRGWRVTQQAGISEDEASNPEQGSREANSQDLVGTQEQEEKKLKNQTKNIPKNYGKAIISFMERYKEVVEAVCNFTGVPFELFLSDMVEFKKTINTIADLRRLWLEYKYARCMRILSNLFFRKYSLSYIFNSRICNFRSHIKYRHRLAEAIKHPQSFKHIKDY